MLHRVLVEDAHDDALAAHGRHRDDAQVDAVAVDGQPDAAVLGQAALGDVELGHDLHARDDAGGHPPRDRRDVAQHAVDAEAHAQVLVPSGVMWRSDAPCLDGLADELVDELDDGRVVGGLVQVDDLRGLLVRWSSSSTALATDVADAATGARSRSLCRRWSRLRRGSRSR